MRFLVTLLSISLTVAFLDSCSKDRPAEPAYGKDKVTSTSVINDKSLFLFRSSSRGAHYQIASASPYMHGDERIVKFKLEKNKLEIYAPHGDPRYKGDGRNDNPVMTIPVEHFDYKCETNNSGECNKKEIENEDIEWNDKKYFKPKFDELVVHQVDSLELFNLNEDCVTKVGVKVTKAGWEGRSVLNIEVENSYKFNETNVCMAPLFHADSLDNSSFKVSYIYSIVRLDTLVSPDYEIVDYPIEDQSKFGFFKTEHKRLNSNNDKYRQNTKYFLHRWNPNRGVITYYMNEEFDKPGNSYLKPAVREAFKRVNEGLDKAQAKISLRILDYDKKVKPVAGDLRYNVINLINDPLANGFLGYGPSTVNPLTGEIVNAQVNMYAGALKTTVRGTFNEMVDLAARKNKYEVSTGPAPHSVEVNSSQVIKKLDENYTSSVRQKLSQDSTLMKEKLTKMTNLLEIYKKIDENKKEKIYKNKEEENKAMSIENMDRFQERKLIYIGSRGADTSDLISTGKSAKVIFPEVEELLDIDLTKKVRWEQLTEEQRGKFIEIVMPHLFVHTLIHELGHNLGLRHNFMGSFDSQDRDEQESEGKGLSIYSSIMDYGASALNELAVFGPYDIAALMYGYARKVEIKKDGDSSKAENDTISIASSIRAMEIRATQTVNENDKDGKLILRRKEYWYCTDENAGSSAACNRFDEGDSYTEIAKFHVESYFDNYKYRNFRNGRDTFTKFGMTRAVTYSDSRFKKARQIFETFEAYAGFYGPVTYSGCSKAQQKEFEEQCGAIKDIRDAVIIVGKMFLDILKTPDLTCVIKNGTDKNDWELKRLSSLINANVLKKNVFLGTPTSCFHHEVKEYFKTQHQFVVAEVGKFFNSVKEESSRFPGSHEISIRGIWPDKLLAMKYLTKRYLGLGVIEDGHGSLIDIPEIRTEFRNIIEHVTLDTPLKNPIAYKKRTGTTVDYSQYGQLAYNLNDNYYIPESPAIQVIWFLELPKYNSIPFNQQLLKTAFSNNKSDDPSVSVQAKSLVDYLSVKSGGEYSTSYPYYKWMYVDIFTATEANSISKIMVDTVYAYDYVYGGDITFDQLDNVYVRMNEKKFIFPNIRNTELGKIFATPDSSQDKAHEIAQLDLEYLKAILEVKKGGGILTEEGLEADPSLGSENAYLAWEAYKIKDIALEYLIKVKGDALENYSKEILSEFPELAPLGAQVINSMRDGSIIEKAELYRKRLELMPKVSR